MNFRRILVAIDRTPLASTVFDRALELARSQQANLRVFYCLGRSDLGDSLIEVEEGNYLASYPIGKERQAHLQQTLGQIEAWLQAYAQKAEEAGVAADSCHRMGEVNEAICDTAQKWEADLIVLGRRGRKGLTEVFLGSVSNYVVHHAPCSVLVVQP
jgi:nucleotide-binding universal stress UspA family protein